MRYALRARSTGRTGIGRASCLPADDVTRLRDCLDSLFNITARPALSPDGEPRHIVSTLLGTLRLALVFVHFDDPPGGPAIEMERVADLDSLFDAFYTTKSGFMDIGLLVSRSIVERHHGRLWAEPNDGPGATFSFSIPTSS